MAINADKSNLWKTDVARSVDFYNARFLRCAPAINHKQRAICSKEVLAAFEKTGDTETRQLAALKRWLVRHGYKLIENDLTGNLDTMPPGMFTSLKFLSAKKKKPHINIPIHCIVKPIHFSEQYQLIVIEAKSTGNATSANRRRKKEAERFAQFKKCYGENVKYILLLCGHFDPFYLGHQAAEGIDWVWEHRLNDLRFLLDKGQSKRNILQTA